MKLLGMLESPESDGDATQPPVGEVGEVGDVGDVGDVGVLVLRVFVVSLDFVVSEFMVIPAMSAAGDAIAVNIAANNDRAVRNTIVILVTSLLAPEQES
jgi:hypothetical protein